MQAPSARARDVADSIFQKWVILISGVGPNGLEFSAVMAIGAGIRASVPARKPRDGLYLPLSRPASGYARGCISAVRNDRVVATKPKSTVTFDVDGVARFTFFRREDRSDRSNKLITG